MSTSGIPLLGPDQQVHLVPQDQISAALASGGKQLAKVRDPQGTMRYVPSDQVETARDQGGTVVEMPPSDEELAFLQQHPDHKWISASANFPNRPAGIYPTGPGNEWRSDPSYSQAPIDLHLAAHTAEYGVGSAALVGAPVALASAGAAIPGAATALANNGSLILSSPVVQKALTMAGQKLAGGALTTVGAGAAYKFLKSIGLLHSFDSVGK